LIALLVRQNKTGTFPMHASSDTPRNASLVRHAHNEYGLALKQITHVVLSPFPPGNRANGTLFGHVPGKLLRSRGEPHHPFTRHIIHAGTVATADPTRNEVDGWTAPALR